MATKTPTIKFDKEKLLGFVPLALQATLVLTFLLFILMPQLKKIGSASREIKEKDTSMTVLKRGSQDMSKLKKDLDALEAKAIELDQRLPSLAETNMLIDSLKAITQESKLKFTSIEPMASIKSEITESGDAYYELPIRIKLTCGFFEATDFLNKIEGNKRLMKISGLAVRTNPGDPWSHYVEIVISTFAKENKKDSKK